MDPQLTPSSDPPSDHAKDPTWAQAQTILETLTALSYSSHELNGYLQQVTHGVCRLLNLDWSVVTLCWDDNEKVLASTIDLGEEEPIYALHGSLTETVVKTRQTLTVEDAVSCGDYGEPPEGYRSYLGVPLRIPQGDVIGTLCSFCEDPRQFMPDEIKIAELFAERAATAIDNYNLYQHQQRFNDMLETELVKRTTELRAAQAKLIEQERLAAIGEFTSMIVHEIRNPLTTLTLGLKYFQKLHAEGTDNERASIALDEAQRLHNLLNELLLYAKPQVLQLSRLDLNQLLQSLWLPLTEMPEACDRHLQFRLPTKPAHVLGDPDKLKQVLINLIRNAYEAIPAAETVTCTVTAAASSGFATIRVHNGGPPIPAEILPQLTQPFCSTKPSGSGLGLAIVKRILDAHNGSFSLQSTAETGTVIEFQLPLAKT